MEDNRGKPIQRAESVLSSISTTNSKKDSSHQKLSRYLVAKGLQMLPIRVVELIWNLEFVEIEDMLPLPQTL